MHGAPSLYYGYLPWEYLLFLFLLFYLLEEAEQATPSESQKNSDSKEESVTWYLRAKVLILKFHPLAERQVLPPHLGDPRPALQAVVIQLLKGESINYLKVLDL